jgi:tetratricopeptide (TPR) repeat protein
MTLTRRWWSAVPVALLLAVQTLGAATADGGETPADARVRASQLLLRRHPLDARAHHRLGDAYIQKARETGDAKYFALAEEALRKALTIAPASSGAVRHLAYVLYSRHAFQEAATEARNAIALDPDDSHAHGILGDALLEVGQYAEAEHAYERMAALDLDLYALSRRSGLRSLHGDVEGAIADLERAIEDGKAAGRPAESIAWAQWQLGVERGNVGRLEAAEAGYQAALTTYPGYHRALAGLGHVRAAQGRDAEAVALYRRAIEVLPQPDYVAALGDLQARMGRGDEARRQYELVEYIGRLSTLNQVLYNRELATFYLDHDMKLDAALTLARQELDVRRDIYAHDLLAWALYKNGQAEAARDAIAQALRLGTRDARLFYHAGMIEQALGNAGEAARYLRLALDTNPHFHLRQADQARRTLRAIDDPSSVRLGSGP